MILSKHARVRILERTKLSAEEVQTILAKSAYVELGLIYTTLYLLVYDARSDQCFVAIVRNDTVVSVMHVWQRLPRNIKISANAPKIQKRTEEYFYLRASLHLVPRLQACFSVFVSIESKISAKVLVPEEFVGNISRTGFNLLKNIQVIECFADEISRIVVREYSECNASWTICVTLRRLRGDIVRKSSCRIGTLIQGLPMFGLTHVVRLSVSSEEECAQFIIGTVSVEKSFSLAEIVSELRHEFLRLRGSIKSNYSLGQQYKFTYTIQLVHDKLSWSHMFPPMSHFDLREYLDPRHPSST